MIPYLLYNGEALAWLMGLASGSADALVVDPPYASGGQSSTARKQRTASKYLRAAGGLYPDFEGDNRDQRSWILWMTLWLSQCYRVLRKHSPACVFTDWRQLPATTDAFQAAGFIWRGVIAWDKTAAARPVLGRFTNQCEYIVWGSKGTLLAKRKCQSDSNVLRGVFSHRVDPSEKHHQTGKPVSLMRDVVRICEPGGLILDPLAGSGSTGVAALELGYRFLGCELLPAYADVAQERLHAALSGWRTYTNHSQLALGMAATAASSTRNRKRIS